MAAPTFVPEKADVENAFDEKNVEGVRVSAESTSSSDGVLPIHVPEKLSRWNRAIESLRGLEARGISRVPPDEREAPSLASYVQMVTLWYSANITANNLAVGFLGPLLFDLGFLDSALIVVFACFVGSLGPAYMAIWGPQSGNRTLVSYAVRRVIMREVDKIQGCGALFHGLLAFEDHGRPQYYSDGRLSCYQCYHRRPAPFSRKRRRHVCRSRYCSYHINLLDHRCLWHDPVSCL